ncbi:MT-A70-like, partial [Dillenia turbinata]
MPKKNPRPFNERELAVDLRHQELRALLVKAHEAFLEAIDLLSVTHNSSVTDHEQPGVLPLFSNLVANETRDEVEAGILNNLYVLPRKSSFFMEIHNLIPVRVEVEFELTQLYLTRFDADCGFNLMVIDPPWENRSAHQKGTYTDFMLTCTKGALVALWVTNWERLEELFLAWGVRYMTSFDWLKVKTDGSLIGELDLFHHRPYECLLLGYSEGEASFLVNFHNLARQSSYHKGPLGILRKASSW